MKRFVTRSLAATGCAAALVAIIPFLAPPGAGAATAGLPDIFEARAEVGGVHDSISVPAYFETFAPYSLSEVDNDSTHSFQAPLYPGFFLFAAAQFYGFPKPPGTSEALWPQGPKQAGVEFVPLPGGSFAESHGGTDRNHADGFATVTGLDAGALGQGGLGRSTSDVTATTEGVRATAQVTMANLALADNTFSIGSVVAHAESIATGTTGGARATGSVELVNAKLLGVPVVLTPKGLAVQNVGTNAPDTATADALLSQAGIKVRRLPDNKVVNADGTISSFDVGGVEIRFEQPTQEFAATLTFGRVRVSARAIRTTAETADAFAPSVNAGGSDAPTVLGESIGSLGSTLSPDPALTATHVANAVRDNALARPAQPTTVRIAQTSPARSGDWSVVAVLLAVAVGALAAGRRVIQIVSEP
jgi:hypothetical protein